MATLKYSVFALALVLAAGCGSSPVAPTPTLAPPLMSEVDYDINIPNPVTATTLKRDYPNGVRLSPIQAQQQYDYTAAYGGSPNVYYGEVAPHCEYQRAGIVVAPRAVAGLATFTAADWPNMGFTVGTTYVWVGRFVYTPVAAPGTYVSDPTGALCPQ